MVGYKLGSEAALYNQESGWVGSRGRGLAGCVSGLRCTGGKGKVLRGSCVVLALARAWGGWSACACWGGQAPGPGVHVLMIGAQVGRTLKAIRRGFGGGRVGAGGRASQCGWGAVYRAEDVFGLVCAGLPGERCTGQEWGGAEGLTAPAQMR